MHCIQCGSQMVNGAKFCHNCGTPVGKVGGGENIRYENCQVYKEKVRTKSGFFSYKAVFIFYADAMSPVKGKYVAKKSREFETGTTPSDNFDCSKLSQEELNLFANQLIRDGWEPLSDRGEEWWHLRFKRRI